MKSTPAPISILLADDNRDGLSARKAILEQQGYRVTTATNGEEALALFAKDAFHLLVTDYKMPRMNGLELIAKLREQAPNLPVILLSGFVEALGFSDKNTGADVVIAKGATEVQQLMRAASRLLNRRPTRKPAGSQRHPTKKIAHSA